MIKQIVLALLVLGVFQPVSAQRGHGGGRAAGHATVRTSKSVRQPRTKVAPIKRSQAARHQFMVQTGYPKGRPGWIIDHIVPLCKGGADAPANMQWQTKADAKAKDKVECK